MRYSLVIALFFLLRVNAVAEVAPGLSALISSPNGGEVFTTMEGSNATINVSFSSSVLSYYSIGIVRVELYAGASVVRGPYTYDLSSTSAITISTVGLQAGTNYKVKVTNAVNSAQYDWSDNYFEVSAFYIPANSVKSTQVLIPGILNESSIAGLTAGQKGVSILYADDLGRTKQTVSVASSPLQKDVMGIHQYDVLGRESTQYLPIASATANDGKYKTGLLVTSSTNSSYSGSPHYSFYNNSASDPTYTIPDDTKPYTQTIFEKSPLNRVIQQGAIGASRQPNEASPSSAKTVKLSYGSNASNEIFKWTIYDNGNDNYTLNRGYYLAQALTSTTVTNEDGFVSKEYKDLEGKTILKQSQVDATTWVQTYYVYDVYNNLRFILTPEIVNEVNLNDYTELGTLPGDTQSGVASTTLSSPGNGNQYSYASNATITLGTGFTSSPGFEVKPFYRRNTTLLNRYAYQYVYDNLNRKIAQKAPETDWSYFVYDKLDRLVLAQDAKQRLTSEWTFTKYDLWGRAVLAGTTTISGTISVIRQAVASSATMYESRGSVVHGYTNNAYPSVADENAYMVISYYDDYNFKSLISGVSAYHYKNDELGGLPTSEYLRTKGMGTGIKTKIVGQNSWLWSVVYFDDKGRTIQTISSNHKGGTDRISTLYNFPGQLLSTRLNHTWGSVSHSIKEEYQYDNAGRLLKKYHQIGTDPANRLLLYALEYNELGQAIRKKLHSTNGGSSFLQTIDVRQNILGSLVSQQSEDFKLGLGYDNNQGITGVAPRYTGEISSVSWMTNMRYTAPVSNKEQAWSFTYDGISQFKNSNYWERTWGASTWGSAATKLTESGLAYDLNGNMMTLVRKDATASDMDNLSYNYGAGETRGNRLLSVTDNGDDTKGFKDGNVGQDYFYDANGNLIKDLNKNITLITYNTLDLTERIQLGSGSYLQYTYDAGGAKLSEELYSTSGSLLKRLDYIGPFVYEETPPLSQPSTLQFIMHDEGRALPIDGTAWEYQYTLRDHVGSARLMLSAAPRYKEYKATMETENASPEEANFLNLPSTRFPYSLANNTPGGNEVAKLYNGSPVGPAISVQVMPGDAISASTYVYHEGIGFGIDPIAEGSLINSIAGAFGGINGAAGEAGQIFSSVQNAIGLYGPGANPTNSHPAAYINYLVFDLDMVPVTGGYVRVGTSPGLVQMPVILIDKPGYVFLFLSNEGDSSTPVYFDDFTIEHQESQLAGVYLNYPFGAEIASQTVERHRMPENLYRYQGKRLEKELGIELYDFHARLYDPFLGRWFAVDPKNQFASPYLGMGNNPAQMVDPDGQFVIPAIILAAKLVGYAYTAYNVYNGFKQGGIHGGTEAIISSTMGFMMGHAGAGIGTGVSEAAGFTSKSAGDIIGRNLTQATVNTGLSVGMTAMRGGNVGRSTLSSGVSSVVLNGLLATKEIKAWSTPNIDQSSGTMLPGVTITGDEGVDGNVVPGSGAFDPLPAWWGHESYLNPMANSVRAGRDAWAPFAMALATAPLSWMKFGSAGSYLSASRGGTFYRAMSNAEYAALQSNNGLTHLAGKELFVSSSANYSRAYLQKAGYDVLVQFNMKSGAMSYFNQVGVLHRTAAASSGWAGRGSLLWKSEQGVMNLGVQSNTHMFNPWIESFKLIR